MGINIFGNKFVCAFCDERMKTENAYIYTDNIGVCRVCSEKLRKTALSMPYKGTRSISYIMSPFEYADPLREAILSFKFRGYRAYAPLFASLMEEYLDSYDIWEDFDYIIPVPLHKTRLKERGYNQSELIAECVAEHTGVPIRTALLTRTRATKQQSTLKRYDRVLNVHGAFGCGSDLTGKKIILFDDICTTGNTLQACADTLINAGADSVCALTLAIHIVEKEPIIMY